MSWMPGRSHRRQYQLVNAVYDAYAAYSDLIYSIGASEEDLMSGDQESNVEVGQEGAR